MFPIPWNFPFRKKNGDMSTIGDVIGGAGSELPPHSGSDAGKVLGVGSDGKLGWTDEISSEIQTLTNNLSNEIETRAKVGVNNLLPFDLDECKALNTIGTWSGNVYSLNGNTFTVDEDGIISANGTWSSAADFYITQKFSVKAGESYTLNGGLNNDGTTTQRIWVESNTAFPAGHRLTSYNTTSAKTTQDALANESNISVYIHIYSGISLSNAVFKPMIRLASDLSSEFAPYAMTNRELTELVTVEDLTSQVTLTENCFSCSLVRQGNICHVNVAAKSGVNGFTSIATVPTALKPKYNTPMACFAVAGADSPKIEDAVLNTNGLISIRTTSATSDIAYLSCTWIV